MYYDKDFNDAVGSTHRKLEEIIHRFDARSGANLANNADWENKRKEVEANLKNELDSFKHPYIKNLVNRTLQAPFKGKFPAKVEIASFYYYVDAINAAPINDDIIKYNLHYLQRNVEQLVLYYRAILDYLQKSSNQRKKVNGPEWDAAQKDGRIALRQLYDHVLPDLARRECEAFLRDVYDSVK